MPSDIKVTNKEFLSAIFREHTASAHVTDFTYDPGAIPDGQHLHAWKGDYFVNYNFKQNSNQYFTISLFHPDEAGVARRRKALYRCTPVIVLDDVMEKLSLNEVEKLPRPSWILETSRGSEQWGYILNTPCEDRARVENLLDGLVANGLAPGGRDPGMKGVTRYVRLPEGVNSKQSKLIDGKPWKCRMLRWQPFNTVTLESLAEPFSVDLDAARRESRVDGAKAIDDHPLLHLDGIINVKEVRSEGRFDITCPWVDEHTNSEDSGTAIFTNGDGSLGFKCHHGSCQDRTGRHLLEYIETQSPGFNTRLTQWQAIRVFEEVSNEISSITLPNSTIPTETVNSYQDLLDMLRREIPNSDKSRVLTEQLLKIAETIPPMEKLDLHTQVRDIHGWTKPELNNILKEFRESWYKEKSDDINFFDEVIFIGEQNQFFDRKKRLFYTAEAYQNAYSHLDPDARKEALQGGRVTKVDRLDYAPMMPPIFEDQGTKYGNSWSNDQEVQGTQGDISPWLDHFKVLGWDNYKQHILQWMAFTIRHPDQKINHMIILGSGEGCGKDWLLYPLVKALANNHMTISGEELLEGFNDYVLSTKHLHINEAELGDRKEALAVSNKLKPLAAAPPDTLRVNQKSIKPINVRNILSCTMTTNSQVPVRLTGPSRRIFALWSDLNCRDEQQEMLPEWLQYWDQRWNWMRNGGAEACIWYLRNAVDLTSFNPSAAPPMTEFLREITEASKTPLQQTLEALIRVKQGAFARDLVTAEDISNTLKAGDFLPNNCIFVDVKYCSPQRVTTTLKGMARVKKYNTGKEIVWCLRDLEKYKNLSESQLHIEFVKQKQEQINSTPLTVVT